MAREGAVSQIVDGRLPLLENRQQNPWHQQAAAQDRLLGRRSYRSPLDRDHPPGDSGSPITRARRTNRRADAGRKMTVIESNESDGAPPATERQRTALLHGGVDPDRAEDPGLTRTQALKWLGALIAAKRRYGAERPGLRREPTPRPEETATATPAAPEERRPPPQEVYIDSGIVERVMERWRPSPFPRNTRS